MNPSPDALRQSLQAFDFKRLFIQNLGWNNPKSAVSREILGQRVSVLAEVGSIPAFLVESPGELPDSSTRRAVHAEVSKLAHENLLVFVDSRASQTLWLYAKREKGKVSFQEHLYTRGQSGELFVAKLAGLFVDIGELDDEGALSVLEAGNKLQSALDVARVSKKFYADYKERREEILAFIHGLPDDKTRARYVTVLLNRLMFVYFLQKKGFLDGDFGYLEGKLVSHERAQPGESSARSGEPSARSSESSARSGEPSARSGEPSARSGESSARSGEPSARSGESSENPTFFSAFLRPLFFEAFARPERPAALLALVGQIPYLNGGLFLPHSLETEFPIEVEDRAFEIIFALFGKYSWYLNDKPDAPDDGDQLSPEVLGHIFEKFINDQKSAGAYYTPEQITDYLCERTVGDLLLDRVCVLENGALRKFESLLELQTGLTETKCRAILHELQKLRLLDPAVGSGAFLVAALKTLDDFYMAIYGWAMANDKPHLAREALGDDRNHPLPLYAIRRRIITENLYGVDLMEGAPDIARLRLFIALVQAAHKLEHLEPLPNIDFNILEGNSLIGMLSCQPEDFAFVNLDVNADFHDISVRKNRLIGLYKAAAADWKENLGQLKTDADALRAEEKTICDAATVAEWNRLGIRTTKPTPVGAHGMRPSFDSSDEATGKLQEAIAGKTEGMGAYHAPLQGAIAGKTVKRPLVLGEIQDLRPFHWAAEFADVMKDGGFDAIITNPPWEIWKPNAKEFFQNYSDLVTKKKMTIKEFETEQTRLLKDPEIADKWTAYAGQFPPVSEYFRVSPDYANQISVVNGKKAGTDINLYKLFVERCFALLKEDGRCGIVIPSGIYTDLGAKQLRELLFGQAQITGLFGFENRKTIFEGVDSRFKFVLLTWKRGGTTESFPAAFMRHDVAELRTFPKDAPIRIHIETVRRLSPDSLSVMEFKGARDLEIAEKMLQFPLLGEKIEGKWNLSLTREFDMTNDSHLFQTAPGEGRLPLFEGKMIHQFRSDLAKPRYWVAEDDARKDLLRKAEDAKQLLAYQKVRLGFRDIARNTDERTMIATVLPPNVFAGNTIACSVGLEPKSLLFAASILDSFVYDWLIRQKVTAHCNFHIVYGMPVPRLDARDARFGPIVSRSARLICTSAEFAPLWASVFPGEPMPTGADRAALRAELDALVAHLYGLSESEFAHILATFPLVKSDVKVAALAAFREAG